MEHSNQIHGKAEWQELRRPGVPLTPEGMRRFTFMMTGATLVFTVAGCNEIFEVFFPWGTGAAVSKLDFDHLCIYHVSENFVSHWL